MGNILSFFKNIFLKEDDDLKNNNPIKNKSNNPYVEHKKEGFRERRRLPPMTIEMPNQKTK